MSDPDRSEDGDESDADHPGDEAPEDDPFGDEAPEDDPFGDEAPEDDPSGDEVFDDGPGDAADDSLNGPDTDPADDPFAALGEGVDDAGEASSRSDPGPDAAADDPFAELDADSSGEPTDEDPFESMGSGDVGEEDVWEALDEGTSVGADATEFGAGSVEGEGAGDTATGPAPGADERVVDKRSYCQQCPHFTAPPETACTHEGTEIVESVDFSRFRVRNCPMVDASDPAFDGE